MSNFYFGASISLSDKRNNYLEENREILSKVLSFQASILNIYVRANKGEGFVKFLFIKSKIEKDSANTLKGEQVNILIEYLLGWLENEKDFNQIEENPIDYMYELTKEFYATRYDLEVLEEILKNRHKNKDISIPEDTVSSIAVEKQILRCFSNH